MTDRNTPDAIAREHAARLDLAESCARQGDVVNAVRMVETLAAEAPGSWQVREKLGELKVRANDFPAAAAHFREAVERKPNDPSLLYKWSRATFDSGSPAQAKDILDEAARLAPGHELILNLYAEIYAGSADWDNLGRTAQAWLRVEPRNPLPWMFAARAQWETGYLAHAIESYRTFLDRGGTNATNLATFGRLCLTARAYDEAARALDAAERLDAECGHMLSAKATLAMYRGRFAEALAYARSATRVNPRDAAAFKVLVQVSGGTLMDDEHTQLRRLSEDESLHPDERISAAFARADCLDAQGHFDAAFAAYEHANALSAARARAEVLDYDRAQRELQIDQHIARFAVAPQATTAASTPIPIFIVGMPRSGTTLVESILGAHSKVLPCGERQEMRAVMQEFAAIARGPGLTGVAASTRKRWRDAFWRELPALRGAVAVTDKNPWNFDALGVILELFPHARVLHVRRDPVETGLSIYRNEFPKFASFAHRLEDIGHYYGAYARLMAHWDEIMGDRFLTIRYEELVADLAGGVRTVLQFCGLEYEDACANPSAGDRIIGTMSAVQARQPLDAFKGRRGHYARHLAPLIAALRDARVDVQAGAFAPDGSA